MGQPRRLVEVATGAQDPVAEVDVALQDEVLDRGRVLVERTAGPGWDPQQRGVPARVGMHAEQLETAAPDPGERRPRHVVGVELRLDEQRSRGGVARVRRVAHGSPLTGDRRARRLDKVCATHVPSVKNLRRGR